MRDILILPLPIVLALAACSAAPLRGPCQGPDDTECAEAKLTLPADPNLQVGRAGPRVPLKQVMKEARARDRSLPAQVTLLIDKSDRTLSVKLGDRVLRTYGLSLGFQPKGHKEREGDGRTPEGEYYAAYTAPPRGTRYHRAILISYPDDRQARAGVEAGLITRGVARQIATAQKRCGVPPQSTPLGGYLLIHGAGGGPGYGDWTLGCVALTDRDIEEVHSVTRAGCRQGAARTRIVIQP